MDLVDTVFVGLGFWYVAFTTLNAFYPPQSQRVVRVTFRVGRPPRAVGT